MRRSSEWNTYMYQVDGLGFRRETRELADMATTHGLTLWSRKNRNSPRWCLRSPRDGGSGNRDLWFTTLEELTYELDRLAELQGGRVQS